jgi:hypothetical protein
MVFWLEAIGHSSGWFRLLAHGPPMCQPLAPRSLKSDPIPIGPTSAANASGFVQTTHRSNRQDFPEADLA